MRRVGQPQVVFAVAVHALQECVELELSLASPVRRKAEGEGRCSIVILGFVRIRVAYLVVSAGLARLAGGPVVLMVGRLVVVISGLVVVPDLTRTRRPDMFGCFVRFAGLVGFARLAVVPRLVVVTGLVPFACLVLFVRFVMVMTAGLAIVRRDQGLTKARLMQGHTRSDRRHEGEGEHGQQKMCHEVPPYAVATVGVRITLLARSSK